MCLFPVPGLSLNMWLFDPESGSTVDEQRRKLKRQYRRLYHALVVILYRHDPIGIGATIDGTPNEYEPEAGSILPRLREVSTVSELSSILREEFVHWFDEDLAGPVETYIPIAEEILAAIRKEAETDYREGGR